MSDEELRSWRDSQFTAMVSAILKNYHYLTPIASSPLARPALKVLETLLPGEADAMTRCWAVRLLLQWAISRLAPVPLKEVQGCRPDQHRGSSPPRAWVPHLLLWYKYIENLSNPRGDVDGSASQMLCRWLGLQSTSDYARELRRGIRSVAISVKLGLTQTASQQELQEYATTLICSPFKDNKHMDLLLSIAATWRGAIPHKLLLQQAQREGLPNPGAALDELHRHRLLTPHPTRKGECAGLPELIRQYYAQRDPAEKWQKRHRDLAEHYSSCGKYVESSWHWAQAGSVDRALHLIGGQMAKLFRRHNARRLLRVIDSIQKNAQHPQSLSLCCLYRSVALSILGRHAETLRTSQQAISYAADKDQLGVAFSLTGLRLSTSDYRSALLFLEKALELLPPGHPDRLPAVARRALILLDQGHFDKTAVALREIEAAENVSDPVQRAYAAEIQIQINRMQNRHDEALRQTYISLQIWEMLGSLPHAAYCYAQAALITAETGNLARAMELAAQGEQLAKQVGYGTGVIIVRTARAYAMVLSGQPDDAIVLLRQCLAECSQMNNQRTLLHIYLLLGRAWAMKEDIGELRGCWLAACRIAKRLETPWVLAELLQELNMLSHRATDKAHQLNIPEQIALELVKHTGFVTSQALADTAGISPASARRVLHRLASMDLLARSGQGRSTVFSDLENTPSTQRAHSDTPGIGVRTRQAEHIVWTIIAQGGSITIARLLTECPISRSTAQRLLSRLVANGLLLQRGKGPACEYVPASDASGVEEQGTSEPGSRS